MRLTEIRLNKSMSVELSTGTGSCWYRCESGLTVALDAEDEGPEGYNKAVAAGWATINWDLENQIKADTGIAYKFGTGRV